MYENATDAVIRIEKIIPDAPYIVASEYGHRGMLIAIATLRHVDWFSTGKAVSNCHRVSISEGPQHFV